MPTLLHEAPVFSPPLSPPRKRWTREQLAEVEASGVFREEQIELVDGELISKMGKNRPHSNVLTAMLIWLQAAFGARFVNVETSIDVNPEDNPTNEPQPDLFVLERDFATFAANPRPQDIRLVVEVSDSTLAFDLGVKALLYARAGIAEYWVLDVPGRRVIVHRDPDGGKYRSAAAFAENENVAPLAAPESFFCWAKAIV